MGYRIFCDNFMHGKKRSHPDPVQFEISEIFLRKILNLNILKTQKLKTLCEQNINWKTLLDGLHPSIL
jgi:hypothetical protein